MTKQSAKLAGDPSSSAAPINVPWTIAGLALIVRLAAAFATGGWRHPETFEYDWIARSLLAGQGMVFPHLDILYYSYAPPLYCWISAASYLVSKSIIPLMILQTLAGAILAVIGSAIAKHLYGGWIAPLAAGVLISFHPGLVLYNVTKAHPLTFDSLFFGLAVLQALRLRERLNLRRALEFGAIVGVGTLCRATLITILPIAGFWLLAITPKQFWKKAIRSLIVVGLCASAVVAPWTIRSSLIHHRFVFIISADSEVFWRGNNLYATGNSYFSEGQLVLETLPPTELADLKRQPNELAQADWFAAHSRAFIREHPDIFIRLTLTKLLAFWWLAPQTGLLYPRSWFWWYMSYYVLVLLLAVAGLIPIFRSGKKARQQLWLIAGFLLSLSVLQSLYYVEGRHRWAVEPILIAISGGGFAMLFESARKTRWTRAKGGISN